MANPNGEDLLRNYPELRPLVLSSVLPTGVRIDAGAYGSVEEVAIPGAICAAKKLHDFFLDTTQASNTAVHKAAARFAKECQLMSTLRHPYIVQFLGICFLPGARLPALVMEQLASNLHDTLINHEGPSSQSLMQRPINTLSFNLKCSLLHNVASGLAFLHQRSPPVIHRDLSARNVLLTDSGKVAKIADLGVARIVSHSLSTATMTRAPGASIYMPPEALNSWNPVYENDTEDEDKKSKYSTGIDIFSFGVVALFTLCQTFPCDLLPPTYREGGKLLGRTELERRKKYMIPVYREMSMKHPLVKMIEASLDFPETRPNISGILSLLEEARCEKVQPQWKTQPVQVDGCVKAMAKERNSYNQATEAHLQRKENELRKMEEESIRQQLETKVARAESRIETYQQLIRQMKEKEVKDDYRAQKQLRKKGGLFSVGSSDTDSTKQLTQYTESYSYQISGPGLHSATANNSTHVLVDITDCNGKPPATVLSISAELELCDQDQLTSCSTRLGKLSLFKKNSKKQAVVLKTTVVNSFSQYNLSYTPHSRGLHKLHILVNSREVPNSPYKMIVYPDPTKLGNGVVKTIGNMRGPYGIVLNSHSEIIVCERDGHRISILDQTGQVLRTFMSFYGDSLNQVKSPKAIAVDSQDNMYITTLHKVYKVNRSGELIGYVGGMNSQTEGLNDPCGVAIYNDELYVCDQNNHCIRVFQLDLKYVRTLCSHGRERGQLNLPRDVKFDTQGRMYISDYGNQRIQVTDTDGQFIQEFGGGKLCGPSGLCLVDKYVYVSDFSAHCILVFENSTGKYLTSFGRFGWKKDQFRYPCSVIYDLNGFIYVCDSMNNRISVL